MHRFYIPNLPRESKILSLTGGEADHAAKVLRVRPGEEITVLNGKGTRVLTQVREVSRARVELETLSTKQALPPRIKLTLFQAVTKPRSMDWIVEKATELGVHCIQPVLTERVVPRIGGSDALKKARKWQRTAIEALKQCGSLWLPSVEVPKPFAGVIRELPGHEGHVVASLSPDAQVAREAVASLPLHRAGSTTARIGVWVGPEGDFTSTELQTLASAGGVAVTLGDNVLRSETAAICAVALIRYELNLIPKLI